MEPKSTFQPRSFVPQLNCYWHRFIVSDPRSVGEVLQSERDQVAHYFRQIGQELVIDEAEGYAFLRQIELDGVESIPRVARRAAARLHSNPAPSVCLREEIARL